MQSIDNKIYKTHIHILESGRRALCYSPKYIHILNKYKKNPPNPCSKTILFYKINTGLSRNCLDLYRLSQLMSCNSFIRKRSFLYGRIPNSDNKISSFSGHTNCWVSKSRVHKDFSSLIKVSTVPCHRRSESNWTVRECTVLLVQYVSVFVKTLLSDSERSR